MRNEDPRVLGRYQLSGRLREHPAGVVHQGRDMDTGTTAVVVVPTSAHAGGLGTAIAANELYPAVLDGDYFGNVSERPWVALRADDPTAPERLLTALHEAGEPQPPTANGPGRGLLLVGVLIAAIVLLVGSVAVFGYRWWFASPDGSVAGPTYARADGTYHMALDDVPFEFDAPGDWSCLRDDPKQDSSDDAGATVSYLCAALGDGSSPPENPAGGRIEVRDCPPTNGADCVPAGWTDTHAGAERSESRWRRVDPDTRYAEWTAEGEDGERAAVAMRRRFAASGSGPADTVVEVRLLGQPGERATLQKLLNEIHDRTS